MIHIQPGEGVSVMNRVSRISIVAVSALMLLPPLGRAGESTADMRELARMVAALEARDLKGFCAQMRTPAYAAYIGKACRYAVQHKLRPSDACTEEGISREARADETECLAMSAAEFEQKVVHAGEVKAAFVKAMAEQGIDGETLLQQARARRP